MTDHETVLGVEIDPTPDGGLHITTLAQDAVGYRLTQQIDADVIREDRVSDNAAQAWLTAYRRRLPCNLVLAA